jgi:hypothetical protein
LCVLRRGDSRSRKHAGSPIQVRGETANRLGSGKTPEEGQQRLGVALRPAVVCVVARRVPAREQHLPALIIGSSVSDPVFVSGCDSVRLDA